MIRRRSRLTALLIVGLAGRAWAGSTEDAIRQQMNGVWQAWSAKDVARAAPFYAKDPELVFFDVAPLRYQGWADYAQGVQKTLDEHEWIRVTPRDDVRIHRRGKLAWCTATLATDLKLKDGTHLTSPLRWTVLLERRGKSWLIVHEHISVVPGS